MGRVPEHSFKIIVAIVLLVVAIDEILSGLLPGALLAGEHSAPTPLAAWQYGLLVAEGLVIGTSARSTVK